MTIDEFREFAEARQDDAALQAAGILDKLQALTFRGALAGMAPDLALAAGIDGARVELAALLQRITDGLTAEITTIRETYERQRPDWGIIDEWRLELAGLSIDELAAEIERAPSRPMMNAPGSVAPVNAKHERAMIHAVFAEARSRNNTRLSAAIDTARQQLQAQDYKRPWQQLPEVAEIEGRKSHYLAILDAGTVPVSQGIESPTIESLITTAAPPADWMDPDPPAEDAPPPLPPRAIRTDADHVPGG